MLISKRFGRFPWIMAVVALLALATWTGCSDDEEVVEVEEPDPCYGLYFDEYVATDEEQIILRAGGEDQWCPDLEDEPLSGPYLEPAFPNPFCPAITIEFSVPVEMVVTIRILDSDCTEIRTLLDSPVAAGVHSIMWDHTDNDFAPVDDGYYACVMTAGDFECAGALNVQCDAVTQ